MECMFYSKKDIQKRFNISLATVNNWIKTGVIPSPRNGLYSQDSFFDLVKSIELNSYFKILIIFPEICLNKWLNKQIKIC